MLNLNQFESKLIKKEKSNEFALLKSKDLISIVGGTSPNQITSGSPLEHDVQGD